MIRKYSYGTPFQTNAVTKELVPEQDAPLFVTVMTETEGENNTASITDGTEEKGTSITYTMDTCTRIYGLGENVRGINKRGFRYVSNNSDNPHHQEDSVSLYASHNFLLIHGPEQFGIFLDYPGIITFDIGYEQHDRLEITFDRPDFDLFVITGSSLLDIVKQFRQLIGRSYIPPKFAFGYGQSRWGYRTAEDFREVVRHHREHHVPLDMVYMDIEYMERYKDFTVNPEEFPDFPAFVQEMKAENIHLVPIIDAGVKIEEGYDVYEEGVEKGYFCKRKDGSNFVAAVWPGNTHFPDFLNADARKWFGHKYQVLLDAGIDGFWNDMNEPAIFNTPERLEELDKILKDYPDIPKSAEYANPVWSLQAFVNSIANNPKDYRLFYHNVDGKQVNHETVHNLYGYNMTRAAGEAFEELRKDERILMFSRSSYTGAHRYGGVWMGDNKSWWSHLLMNLQMLPNMNMNGFLYTGADIGGFGSDTTRDLVLRWLALGVFTPLMRNHSADGTRRQEFYQFEGPEDFESVISVRYRLIPYIYSEYMKAVLTDEMLFKPLAFVYPEDAIAADVEDQLMLGHEVMIAPVYTQNAEGRFVYLPENMMLVRFQGDGSIFTEKLEKGIHYVKTALNEVTLFIREGCCLPVAEKAECVKDIDTEHLTVLGYEGAEYALYEDDGISKEYDLEKNCRIISV